MRHTLPAVLCCLATVACAQGYLPLSRTVEAPYAAALHRTGAFHTGIRPYLREEVAGLPGADTLAPKAALHFLDRWAGDSAGGIFRGGPLLDAMLFAPMDEREPLVHRASAGTWLELVPRSDLSFHADVQVWNEAFPEYLDTLVRATRVSLGEGMVSGSGPAYTHYDWNAYVDWKTAKYFRLTMGRGKHFFGEGYRSMFLSDAATSYPYFRITTTAWHIRYVNVFALLNDIRGAGEDPARFTRKYASFHYLSWNASKRFNFGVFESIVWQGGDQGYPRGFDINYLNPVILYRPLEFAQGSADNALLGISATARAGRNTTLYAQAMLDEFLLSEVRAGKGWYANKQGLQLGVAAHDAFRHAGLFLRLEFNYVRPFMYTHSDTRQNYAHYGQPLAHPYGSNFHETIGEVKYRHGRWSHDLHVSYAILGSDTGAYSSGNNIFRPESDRKEPGTHDEYHFYVGDVQPTGILYADLSTGWLIDPHTGLRLEAGYTFRSRVPEQGANTITHVFRLGVSTAFREHYRDQEVRYVLP